MTEKDPMARFDMMRFKADTLYGPEMQAVKLEQMRADLADLQKNPDLNADKIAVIKPIIEAQSTMYDLLAEVATGKTSLEVAQEHIEAIMTVVASLQLQIFETALAKQKAVLLKESNTVLAKAMEVINQLKK